LIIKQKIYSFKQTEEWQRKINGYKASFVISDDAMEALYQSPEDGMINLNSPILSIRFGVGGFNNIHEALSGSEVSKPARNSNRNLAILNEALSASRH